MKNLLLDVVGFDVQPSWQNVTAHLHQIGGRRHVDVVV